MLRPGQQSLWYCDRWCFTELHPNAIKKTDINYSDWLESRILRRVMITGLLIRLKSTTRVIIKQVSSGWESPSCYALGSVGNCRFRTSCSGCWNSLSCVELDGILYPVVCFADIFTVVADAIGFMSIFHVWTGMGFSPGTWRQPRIELVRGSIGPVEFRHSREFQYVWLLYRF